MVARSRGATPCINETMRCNRRARNIVHLVGCGSLKEEAASASDAEGGKKDDSGEFLIHLWEFGLKG